MSESNKPTSRKRDTMVVSQVQAHEDGDRQSAGRRLCLIDSSPDAALDRIIQLAARVLNVPLAVLHLGDQLNVFRTSAPEFAPVGLAERDMERVQDFCRQVVAHGGTIVLHDALIDSPVSAMDAERGLIACLGAPLRLTAGEVIGSLCIFDQVPRAWTDRDGDILTDLTAGAITELILRQERAERAAREHAWQLGEQYLQSERIRLQQILDVIPEGIVIAGDDHRLSLCNAAGTEILGHDVTNEDPLGPRIGAFNPRGMEGTPIAVSDVPLARSLLNGETVRGERILIRNPKTEQDVPILISSAPLQTADGSISGAVAIFQDISEITHVEQQRDEFVATVSHDLRSPITAIRGHAQMLQRLAHRMDIPQSPRLMDGLNRIEGATRHMVQILDDLVDLAYLAINRDLAMQLQPTDLAVLARDTVADYQERSESHTVRLETDGDLVGTVDGPRLQRVLENLLSNALKYSPDGGEILVRIRRVEQSGSPWGVFEVIDHGVGIPAEDLPRIFDRYSRGGNVGGIKGTGLGLAGVRQIILQHGGTIDITSDVGRGTTVIVTVPLTSVER
ncbi:MAG: ATP-binding protein [Chloroflexota bacterium]